MRACVRVCSNAHIDHVCVCVFVLQAQPASERPRHTQENQERGRVQHTLDDMNYLIDGLNGTNNTTETRCLSILTLANKCLIPATRDLVHAYGLLKQICANLQDAHTDYVSCLPFVCVYALLSSPLLPSRAWD